MECYSNIMIHFLTQANFQDPQHLLFIFPSTVCYLGSLVYPWSINYVLISDPFSASVGPMMAHRTTLSWVHTVPFLSFLPPCWCELTFARAFLIFPLLHLSCIVLFFFFYKGGSDWHSQNTCSSNCTNLTGSSSALGHFPFLCLLASTLLKSSLCQVPYSPFSLFMLRDDLGPLKLQKTEASWSRCLPYLHSQQISCSSKGQSCPACSHLSFRIPSALHLPWLSSSSYLLHEYQLYFIAWDNKTFFSLCYVCICVWSVSLDFWMLACVGAHMQVGVVHAVHAHSVVSVHAEAQGRCCMSSSIAFCSILSVALKPEFTDSG